MEYDKREKPRLPTLTELIEQAYTNFGNQAGASYVDPQGRERTRPYYLIDAVRDVLARYENYAVELYTRVLENTLLTPKDAGLYKGSMLEPDEETTWDEIILDLVGAIIMAELHNRFPGISLEESMREEKEGYDPGEDIELSGWDEPDY